MLVGNIALQRRLQDRPFDLERQLETWQRPFNALLARICDGVGAKALTAGCAVVKQRCRDTALQRKRGACLAARFIPMKRKLVNEQSRASEWGRPTIPLARGGMEEPRFVRNHRDKGFAPRHLRIAVTTVCVDANRLGVHGNRDRGFCNAWRGR